MLGHRVNDGVCIDEDDGEDSCIHSSSVSSVQTNAEGQTITHTYGQRHEHDGEDEDEDDEGDDQFNRE